MPQQQIEMEEAIRENNLQQQNAINLAEANKNVGMALAVEHADDQSRQWSDRAMFWLKIFIGPRSTPFMAETVREFAAQKGLPPPPSERAWGSVIHKAARAGLIIFSGYAKTTNPRAHRTPAALWRAA